MPDEELLNQKLRLEIRKLQDETSKDFGYYIQQYTGVALLIGSFLTALIAYFSQISSFITELTKTKIIEYNTTQLEQIGLLGDSNPWLQKKAMLVLAGYGTDNMEFLLERVRMADASERSNELDNLSETLFRIKEDMDEQKNCKQQNKYSEEISKYKNLLLRNFKEEMRTSTSELLPFHQLYNYTYMLAKLKDFNVTDTIGIDTIYGNLKAELNVLKGDSNSKDARPSRILKLME